MVVQCHPAGPRVPCPRCGEPTRRHVCLQCEDNGLGRDRPEPPVSQSRADPYAHSLELHPLRVVPMADGALLEVSEDELDRWLAHRAWDVREIRSSEGRLVRVEVHGASVLVYARAVARQEAA